MLPDSAVNSAAGYLGCPARDLPDETSSCNDAAKAYLTQRPKAVKSQHTESKSFTLSREELFASLRHASLAVSCNHGVCALRAGGRCEPFWTVSRLSRIHPADPDHGTLPALDMSLSEHRPSLRPGTLGLLPSDVAVKEPAFSKKLAVSKRPASLASWPIRIFLKVSFAPISIQCQRGQAGRSCLCFSALAAVPRPSGSVPLSRQA